MANVLTEAASGATLLIRGARLLVQRPKLFLLGAVPPLVMSVLFAIALVALVTQLGTINRKSVV